MSGHDQSGSMMHFKKIILGAIGYVYEGRRRLAKALLIPFILFVLLSIALTLELNGFAALLVMILWLMVQTLFAVTTHRIVLLGPDSVPEWGVLGWSKRESFFLIHMIIIGFLTTLPALPIAVIPYAGWIIALGIYCWLLGRLSLVFPAIAVDQDISFITSWKLTEKWQLLMSLVVTIFPMLLIPAALLQFLPFGELFYSLFSMLITIFTVAALSVAYKHISQKEFEAQ